MYEYGEYKVALREVGRNRIAVIKALRENTALGILEAAELLERVPTAVKEGYMDRQTADAIRKKLTDVGAIAEMQKVPIPGVDYL